MPEERPHLDTSAAATAGSCERELPQPPTAVAWGHHLRDEDQGNQRAPKWRFGHSFTASGARSIVITQAKPALYAWLGLTFKLWFSQWLSATVLKLGRVQCRTQLGLKTRCTKRRQYSVTEMIQAERHLPVTQP